MDRIQWWRPAHRVLNQISSEWYKPSPLVSCQAPTGGWRQGVSEWIPQHTIFFNNTNMGLEHHIVLGKKLCYIGCKTFCFGRTASGESFTGGYMGRRHFHACHAGQPIWFEQLRLEEGGKAMTGAVCLGSRGMCALLIAARDGLPASIMRTARESLGTIAAGQGHFGVSQFNSFLVVHYVGHSSEAARRIMVQCWSLLWPEMQARETTATRN